MPPCWLGNAAPETTLPAAPEPARPGRAPPAPVDPPASRSYIFQIQDMPAAPAVAQFGKVSRDIPARRIGLSVLRRGIPVCLLCNSQKREGFQDFREMRAARRRNIP